MKIKNNKGVTLVSLTITIIILLVITGAMIFNTKNQISMQKVNKLNIDIQLLNSKVDEYYLKYGELPILCEYTDSKSSFNSILNSLASERGASLNCDLNINDGDEYAVIELEKLGGITLNYGYDSKGEYSKIKLDPNKSVTLNGKMADEIYVINTRSHQIYFPHGIFADDLMYYTLN